MIQLLPATNRSATRLARAVVQQAPDTICQSVCELIHSLVIAACSSLKRMRYATGPKNLFTATNIVIRSFHESRGNKETIVTFRFRVFSPIEDEPSAGLLSAIQIASHTLLMN